MSVDNLLSDWYVCPGLYGHWAGNERIVINYHLHHHHLNSPHTTTAHNILIKQPSLLTLEWFSLERNVESFVTPKDFQSLNITA